MTTHPHRAPHPVAAPDDREAAARLWRTCVAAHRGCSQRLPPTIGENFSAAMETLFERFRGWPPEHPDSAGTAGTAGDDQAC